LHPFTCESFERQFCFFCWQCPLLHLLLQHSLRFFSAGLWTCARTFFDCLSLGLPCGFSSSQGEELQVEDGLWCLLHSYLPPLPGFITPFCRSSSATRLSAFSARPKNLGIFFFAPFCLCAHERLPPPRTFFFSPPAGTGRRLYLYCPFMLTFITKASSSMASRVMSIRTRNKVVGSSWSPSLCPPLRRKVPFRWPALPFSLTPVLGTVSLFLGDGVHFADELMRRIRGGAPPAITVLFIATPLFTPPLPSPSSQIFLAMFSRLFLPKTSRLGAREDRVKHLAVPVCPPHRQPRPIPFFFHVATALPATTTRNRTSPSKNILALACCVLVVRRESFRPSKISGASPRPENLRNP